nr:Tn3 family transposase [Nocardia abscessus]
MAAASGISYDILAWTAEWYVREETLRAANLAIIGYHQRLPLTTVFGTGTLSSSDGQRFPTRGKSTTARAVNHFLAEEGLSTYTQRHRPAHHLRHQGHRHHPPRSPLRPG